MGADLFGCWLTKSGCSVFVRLSWYYTSGCRCPELRDGRLEFRSGRGCTHLDCFWELLPPDSEQYRLLVSTTFNLSAQGDEFLHISHLPDLDDFEQDT